MEIHRVQDNMYEQSFTLIVNCTEKEFSEWIKKKFDLEVPIVGADGKYYSVEKTLKDGRLEVRRFVWVRLFKWNVTHMAMLVHELQHFCFRVLRDVGMALSLESEEAYTWYLQHLTGKSFWALSYHHPSRKRKRKLAASRSKKSGSTKSKSARTATGQLSRGLSPSSGTLRNATRSSPISMPRPERSSKGWRATGSTSGDG